MELGWVIGPAIYFADGLHMVKEKNSSIITNNSEQKYFSHILAHKFLELSKILFKLRRIRL